ncbi:MFS transporter [Pantoea sp.]|uniref:MFS transporter n=1 Tax=Pantoea sp. TaxID=69393 RepID=UPI0028A7DFEA|nr:MFS transporter [Pantoea sp.]
MKDLMPSVPAKQMSVIVLLTLAVGGFAIGTSEFAAMALIPYYSLDLGISQATASHIISAYALGVVIGAPTFAIIGSHFSRRKMLVALMFIYGIAHIGTIMSTSYHGLLMSRFVSGLPHGAYFGTGALLAASIVPVHKRSSAVSLMMTGLMLATVLGVPFANVLGQIAGWRWGFGLAGTLALITSVLLYFFAPKQDVQQGSGSTSRELSALKNPQVIITLLTGAIGFGGFFAVYSFISSTLIQITEAGEGYVSLVLGIVGFGMFVGTLVVGHFADKDANKSTVVILLSSVILMLIYPYLASSLSTLVPVLFLIGCTACLSIPLQARMVEVSGNGQMLASALNQSAFATAQAIGPALVGFAVSQGGSYLLSGYIGAFLSLMGCGLFLVAIKTNRQFQCSDIH